MWRQNHPKFNSFGGILVTIKPVEHIPAPGYPDKYDETLKRILPSARPRRWLGTPLTASVLSAAIALSVNGCATGSASTPSPESTPFVMEETPLFVSSPETTPPTTDTSNILDYVTMGEPAPYGYMIPLFEYGEGTGAIGCVSIAAPVFMSEEEAFAILSAAFNEAGLTLDRDSIIIKDATLPVTNIYSDELYDPSTTRIGDLSADGALFIQDGSLPIEFVSVKDAEDWHEDIIRIDPKYGEVTMVSSVSVFNVRDAARTLAENNPELIVFYDPIAAMDYNKLIPLERGNDESDEDYQARWATVMEAETQSARAESERLLREQAESLIEWLRDEGIF